MTEFLAALGAFITSPAGVATVAAVAHALPYVGVKLPIIHGLFTSIASWLGVTPSAPAIAPPASPAVPEPPPATRPAPAHPLFYSLTSQLNHLLSGASDPATVSAFLGLLGTILKVPTPAPTSTAPVKAS